MKLYTEVVGGRAVQWRLERDKRLKRIHMQVHPQEGVVIRAPMGTQPGDISEIWKTKGPWLLSCIDEISRLSPHRQYANGQVLPYLGQEVQLELLWTSQLSGAEVCWDQGIIRISLSSSYKNQARDTVRNCLMELYKQRAREWFPPRVDMLNKQHFRHKISRVTIKSQVSILGSCSSLGNLNFNWRLLLAPLEVVDYVILHELAHMTEMNHSKKFWRIVEKACPDHRLSRTWLRENNATLYI